MLLERRSVTLDALHCQKATTQTIIKSENDYLIAVKKNQPKLYQALETVSQSQSPLSIYQEEDKSHGRNIERKVSVFTPYKKLDPNWQEVKSFIKEDNTPFSETQAMINFSILNAHRNADPEGIALNLFRILGFLSITEGQRWLCNRWSRLWVLLE